MAFADELSAFRAYAEVFGDAAVFVLDTCDPVAAARMLTASGLKPKAVRIDSGDMIAISREVRRIFDEHGLHDTAIVASGDLDELRIAEIVASGAPIVGFGVGTRSAHRAMRRRCQACTSSRKSSAITVSWRS